MPAAGQVRITGLDDTVRGFRHLTVEVTDLRTAFAVIARSAAIAASAAAPRRTGRLAASIRPRATRFGAFVTANTPYAGAVNYGWPRRHIHATRFMQRADATIRITGPDLIERAIAQLIAREGMA